LRRYWNYGISDAQPAPPGGPNNALLATDITACSFTYDTSPSGLRTGVLTLTLKVERNGESVRLFQQVHVNNVP
jgi:MSHA biogenesis protein MshO